jgi:hypothetical protein
MPKTTFSLEEAWLLGQNSNVPWVEQKGPRRQTQLVQNMGTRGLCVLWYLCMSSGKH